MSINFDEWCEDRAAKIMEEKHGEDWIYVCPDDAYDKAIEQAWNEFLFEDYNEDEVLDEYLKWYDSLDN